ncbi:unnamed protein product, partial [Rotaria socialis]
IAELVLCSIATPLSYYTIFFKIKNEKPVEEEGEQRPGKIGVLSFCQSGDITGQEIRVTRQKHTDLQNEVNDRICKQQVSAKISTHGLSFISGNLVYDARQPEEIGLVPLGEGPKIVSARDFCNDLCEKVERERRSNRKNKSSNYHKDIGDDIQMSEFALQKNVPLGPADLNLLATVGPRTIHLNQLVNYLDPRSEYIRAIIIEWSTKFSIPIARIISADNQYSSRLLNARRCENFDD